ncbi:MAG: peptidase [Gemmataceae bacterium]|nr:peptidase [Gemmataceae bacterium]
MQRRTFLSAMLAAGTAPAILAGRDKSGLKLPVIGEGDHKYECYHGWGQLPKGVDWQTTHGVCVDAEGLVYIKQQGWGDKPFDTVHVFDDKGKHVRSFGKEYHKGGHGIDVRKEDGKEWLYLTNSWRRTFCKTDLKGEVVWCKSIPSGKHYREVEKFSPTNVAFAPDGGFYVGDGYGSNLIHQYDKDAKHVRTWGGTGVGEGQMRTPHGIWLDARPGREAQVVVADRANARLQYFTLDGKFAGFVKGLLFPANIDTQGDTMLVPDLHARVTLYGKDNKVLAQLGDDEAWRKKVLTSPVRMKPAEWQPGKFVHPHDACFDKAGNIYLAEWVHTGRVTFLRKV